MESQGACSLPGCTIKFDSFMTCMRRAQSRGYVRDDHAEFVAQGLRYGFDLGLDRSLLKGNRVFKNWASATEGRVQVTAAINKRMEAGKSLLLGPWRVVEKTLRAMGIFDYFVFPMGAVAKKDDPTVLRPTDDHTKTGLNAQPLSEFLKHSLNTYAEVAWLLKRDYFMYVSDVQDAFLLLPLAPWVWFFMLFRYFARDSDKELTTGVHLFGDFGTRYMPGCFYIFFVKVVIPMGRSEMVLTLPIAVYVDDCAIIGPQKVELDDEVAGFQGWSWETCGVAFKFTKDRDGSRVQEMIGFIWSSPTLTRALPDKKLSTYLQELMDCSRAASLTLRDRQSIAGKMQRAIMTLPPGAACFLANAYVLMSGLLFCYQRRRTTRAERRDYQFVHILLSLNAGRGYYSYDGFLQGPEARSDASKSRKYAGGGWVVADGAYDFYQYGASAKRSGIDTLEGDSVRRCCGDRGSTWRGMLIPFGIDNSSFEGSASRGRSRAERLNEICKDLFVLQLTHCFILAPFWLSSEDNRLPDALSRNDEERFLSDPTLQDFLLEGAALQRCPTAGRVVTFEGAQVSVSLALQSVEENPFAPVPFKEVEDFTPEIGDSSSSFLPYVYSFEHVGSTRTGGAAIQQLSVPYARSSIYSGLPTEYTSRVDELMDTRLAPSSMGKVMTAHRRWVTFCTVHEYPILLETDYPLRGGQIVHWVMTMVDDTELVFKSISTYVWGMRTWQQLQHQADPVLGVMGWSPFFASVAVVTHVAGEPREEIPLHVVRAILEALDWDDIEDVQFGLITLICLFTFSRAECPCPHAFTGPGAFDETRHWQVEDIVPSFLQSLGRFCLCVRFKGVKQDPRCERPTGKGGDWATIGDLPDEPTFSIMRWYTRYVELAGPRQPGEPFFLARDRARAYTYPAAMSDLRKWLERVGVPTRYGMHGLRVLGYNLSIRGNGEALTVAQGGWLSEAHDRYHRFGLQEVVGIPAGMLGVDAPEVPCRSADGIREIHRGRTVRGSARPDGAGAEEDPASPVPRAVDTEEATDSPEDVAIVSGGGRGCLLPPGYMDVVRRGSHLSRTYTVVQAPDGRILPSRSAAWRHFSSRPSSAFGAGSSSSARAVSPGAPPSSPRSASVGRVRPDASPARRSTRASSGRHVRFGELSLSADSSSPATVAPASAQDVEFLEEVVTYVDRPSTRRAPTLRGV